MRSICRYDSFAAAPPMWCASSAYRTWIALRSASEYTAAVGMPSSRHARMTRIAISPRFAIKIFLKSLLFIPLNGPACSSRDGEQRLVRAHHLAFLDIHLTHLAGDR